MYDRVLRRLRRLAEAGSFLVTIHALDEMAEDDVLVEEAIHAVILGFIVEAQTDQSTREKKYVVNGPDHQGRTLGVVVKIGASGKLVVLTVYREELT
jgi:hypothetical protein